jgi:hypothetical protein
MISQQMIGCAFYFLSMIDSLYGGTGTLFIWKGISTVLPEQILTRRIS